MQALKGNKLPISSLNPDQQALVRRYALYLDVQHTLDHVGGLATELREAQRAVFRHGSAREKGVLGYDVIRADNTSAFVTFATSAPISVQATTPEPAPAQPNPESFKSKCRGERAGRSRRRSAKRSPRWAAPADNVWP